MDFSDLLRRANLNCMEAFLLNGGESDIQMAEKTYSERLMEAEESASDFFQERFGETKELDEITAHFYRFAGVFQDVYFEIGLIAGAAIAFQIGQKMEELK